MRQNTMPLDNVEALIAISKVFSSFASGTVCLDFDVPPDAHCERRPASFSRTAWQKAEPEALPQHRRTAPQ